MNNIRRLILINSLVWFGLSVGSLIYLLINGFSMLRLMYLFIMLCVCCVVFYFYFQISSLSKASYSVSLVVFGILTITSLTDDLGIIDIGIFLLSGITFIVLLTSKKALLTHSK
ncbi:hypothetical protein KC573_02320 [candidate division WWE3 bacterium]|uniref:Uncharacterized protein n=1 Tax=candidate division WWE3 bacterium TaxID=2053526 RepID=A0A955LVR7_UNCKA|nr:hypothetical protein [candidate division WWE3 bacterium]